MSEENVEIVREAHERFTKTGQPIWERIDADTEDLNFSFEVALPLVDKGRHLGPAPGSPAAAIKKEHRRRGMGKYRGELYREAVDII